MTVIDVVVTAYGPKDEIPVWPSDVLQALREKGFRVRSVVVLDSNTGLTGSITDAKVKLS